MKKIFIDCGTNFGQGLRSISKLENMDVKWDVYSFEANPEIFKEIEKNKYIRYFNVAVSDYYGFSNYSCEELIQDNKSSYNGGGSTLLELNEWNIDRVYGFKPNYKSYLVPVIDITDFIITINPPEKSIIIKLDVEGCEFNILSKLEELNLFKFISKIYIEFHEHLLTVTPKKGMTYWVNFFVENNIDYVLWD